MSISDDTPTQTVNALEKGEESPESHISGEGQTPPPRTATGPKVRSHHLLNFSIPLIQFSAVGSDRHLDPVQYPAIFPRQYHCRQHHTCERQRLSVLIANGI